MKKLVIVLFLLIVIGSVNASYIVGNDSSRIETVYGPGENLRGWINMSLTNEPLTSEFEGQVEGVSSSTINVDLISLLKSDSRLFKGTDYTCNPVDCGIRYEAINGEETKTFSLKAGKTKTLGFKFTGILGDITKVEFDISSDAGPSCSNQMEITFLLDEEIKIGNNKSHSDVCDPTLRKDGCFNDDHGDFSNYIIPKGPSAKYCQRIKLTESPGFRLGAWMNLTNDSGDITLGIYDADESYLDEELESCDIVDASGMGEFFCDVDFLVVDSKDYYVCVYSDSSDEESQIRGYSVPGEGCGFYDTGSGGEESFAFDIFATGRKFDEVGSLEVRDSLPGDVSLASEFYEEIGDMTGGDYNCSEGCVIPFKIKSGIDQDITINKINIQYPAGVITLEKKIYDVNISSATLSTTGFKLIYIDEANFTLPDEHGGVTYDITFEGTEIFNNDITIQEVPTVYAISPTTTASKFPTSFKVFTTKIGNDTISSYNWDFDGETFTTTEPQITYTFDETGIFPVKVTIIDSMDRRSSKTFNVNVGSYISVLNERINKSKNDLKNIETDLESFTQFEQDGIKEKIDTNVLRTELTQVESLYGQSRYEEAVEKLLLLEIPESIDLGVSTSLVSFYPTGDNINLDVVQSFQGGSYPGDKEVQYQNAVVGVHTSNLDTKVKYSKIVAVYEGAREELLLNVLDFKASQLNALNYSLYIYLEDLEGLRFATGYEEKTEAGYVEIPFDNQEKTITFSTTEEINFLDLPIFISPALSNLVVEDINGGEEKGIRWALFIMLIILLLIIGFIVYIILQQWYKNKYEAYLFKNKNFLYNLITYIQNSKKKGIPDSEIIKKLKKTGWNSEQITYVMRKYVGKRTGMLEIPIDKVLSKFGKKKMPPASGVVPKMPPKPFRPIPQLKRPLPAQKFQGKSPIVPGKLPINKGLPPGKKRFFQK